MSLNKIINQKFAAPTVSTFHQTATRRTRIFFRSDQTNHKVCEPIVGLDVGVIM